MDDKIKCKQCGKEFILTESEKDFYIKKGLQLPKRCKDCRESNKQGSNGAPQKEQTQSVEMLTSLLKKPGGVAAAVIALIVVAALAWFLLPELRGYDDGTPPASSYSQAADPDIEVETEPPSEAPELEHKHYSFRNNDRLVEHYEKHGIEMGFASAEEYEQAANDVIYNPDSLTKREAEDNDDVYYLEATGEFVVVSTDGYIRTYYYADLDYFNRQ